MVEYFPAAGMEIDGLVLEDNGIVSGIDLVEQCVQIIEQSRAEDC